MTSLSTSRMKSIRGGNCEGLHRLAIVAALLGQPELSLAAELTAILEGCPV